MLGSPYFRKLPLLLSEAYDSGVGLNGRAEEFNSRFWCGISKGGRIGWQKGMDLVLEVEFCS